MAIFRKHHNEQNFMSKLPPYLLYLYKKTEYHFFYLSIQKYSVLSLWISMILHIALLESEEIHCSESHSRR